MDIHRVLKKLAGYRPIFHSEADFQYSFALTIKEMHPTAAVRLEYPIRLITGKKQDNRALDIWIQNMKTAIELKYPNRKLASSVNSEAFYLKTSRIHNYRYFFVEDLSRIEDLVHEHNIERGYAIVVTNNRSMWSRGRGASEEFSLVDTLEGRLTWHGTRSPKKTPIDLQGKYRMDWKEYSNPNNQRFRYLVLEVVKEEESD